MELDAIRRSDQHATPGGEEHPPRVGRYRVPPAGGWLCKRVKDELKVDLHVVLGVTWPGRLLKMKPRRLVKSRVMENLEKSWILFKWLFPGLEKSWKK